VPFVTISSVTADQVRSITLVSAAGVIELDDVEGTWQIVKPAVMAVKDAPLNDLLFSVTTLSSERVIEENPKDLAPYGLDKPAVTVRLTLTTGEVRELYLGDMTPAADSYYLMAKGDPRVFTVREHHGTFFHYGVRDLWQGARTPIDGGSVVEARIRRAGKLIVEIENTEELNRSDVEFRGTSLSVVYPWISSPKPVDTSFLYQFAISLGSLQAEVAVDANPADPSRYGLDKPSGELLLKDGKGKSLHVVMGKQEGGALYLQFEGDPTVYAGDPRFLQILEVDPVQFVNKLVAIVKLDRIDRLTISGSGTKHVLEVRRKTPGSEDGAAWLVDGRAVEVKTFKDFYVSAISMQADALHDDSVSGIPDVTMEFTLNSGPLRTYAVRFVPHSQEFYAVVKGGKSDLLVNRQQVKVLLQQLDELVKFSGG
jgi:hypothetical protein